MATFGATPGYRANARNSCTHLALWHPLASAPEVLGCVTVVFHDGKYRWVQPATSISIGPTSIQRRPDKALCNLRLMSWSRDAHH
jgi:hypothetical protein